MKKNLVSLFVILLISSRLLGQSDFRNGYYITLENDTIYGLLDYRGDIRNCEICVFKADANALEQKFEPVKIASYRFTDSKYYISKNLKFEDGTEKLVFAEYLVNGISDLFFYRDSGKEHYFIETKEGKLIELTNEEKEIYVEGKGNVIIETNKYKQMLNYAFADCPEIKNEITNARLNKKSMVNIVKDYHNYVCEGEKCIIYEKKIPKFKAQIIPVIGLNYSDLELSKDNQYSKYDLQKSTGYSFGMMIKFLFPQFSEKLSITFSTEITKNDFYASSDYLKYFTIDSLMNGHDDFYLNILALDFGLPVTYAFPLKKIKPIIGIGPILRIVVKEDSKLVITYTDGSFVQENKKICYPLSEDVPYPSKVTYGLQALAGINYPIYSKYELYTLVSYNYYVAPGMFGEGWDLTQFQVLGLKVGFKF